MESRALARGYIYPFRTFLEARPRLLPEPFNNLDARRYFEFEQGRLNAGVDSNVGKDKFRTRTIHVGEQESSNVVCSGIDVHDEFLYVRLSFRVHTDRFGSVGICFE